MVYKYLSKTIHNNSSGCPNYFQNLLFSTNMKKWKAAKKFENNIRKIQSSKIILLNPRGNCWRHLKIRRASEKYEN
jgi:hypothetical protein